MYTHHVLFHVLGLTNNIYRSYLSGRIFQAWRVACVEEEAARLEEAEEDSVAATTVAGEAMVRHEEVIAAGIGVEVGATPHIETSSLCGCDEQGTK